MPDGNGRLTFGWAARSALLLLWALVAWGGLLLLVTLGDVVSEGLGPALRRLLPTRESGAWGWLNALCAGLALVVAAVATGLLLWARLWATKRGGSAE